MRIGAAIIALNEERNIARAIESLAPCADEIVVVDSGSSDRTSEIAASMGAKIVKHPWQGYAEQKNFAAACVDCDWILSLDADEALSPALAAEIAALKRHEPAFHAWSFPRLAQYMGRWIHHSGWYPDRKVRLYRKSKASWQGAYVHETLRVEGPVGELRHDLLHFTCDSLSEHLRTLDRYTTLAARELTDRRQSATLLRLVFHPPWTFFRSFILRRGFLDGLPGFCIAWMAALYTFVKYAKTREPRASKEQENA